MTRHRKTHLALTAALAALASFAPACSSSSTAPGSDSGSDTGSDTGGSDTGSDTGTGGVCPATTPDNGAGCAREGLVCEYGDDPRPSCHTTATCTGGAFALTSPRCVPLPEVTCPDSRATAQGTACPDAAAICTYEDGLDCHCTNCPPGSPICMDGPLLWWCEAPNADASCPPSIPNQGTSCGSDGQVCTYGCDSGTQRTCVDGAWVATDPPGGCPVSTRRAKTDIDYLAPGEVDALARVVGATRLATYEYTDPALAGRRRLGFILEDQPGSYAVDPERSQVDLYGYTSLLVAAVQSQERRIVELERELAALREEAH